MATIALICEGVSEVKMLRYIIERYLGEDVSVNRTEPSIILTHGHEKQADDGGWLQVLNHCNDTLISDIFAANDYLVIQIDTDTCSQKNYDVDIYDENNNLVEDEVLYDRVVERLNKNISAELLCKYDGKILYAVCINETECWLLPIYYMNDAKTRCSKNNCIFKLNKKLTADGLFIPDKDKNSDNAVKTYDKIMKKLKKKDIPTVAQYNYGFKRFVEQLDTIKVSMEGEPTL